ncbi:BRO-N domain-containing protein [Deferribacter abyssi]|uniref:BRO-N domain-containing protein n=1 Tax=Deferribacter abyssi TaxID=213806 RepID=UPI003C1471AF
MQERVIEEKNAVIPFGYGDNLVRTVNVDGEVWFVAKDVALALGYSNYRDAISKHVDEEDRDAVAIRDAIGREQQTTIINESGLYSLIFGSQKAEAKQFKKWVTSEVLPSLRKRGHYSIREDEAKYIERLEERIRSLENMIASYFRLESEPLTAGDYMYTTEDILAHIAEKVAQFNAMTMMSAEYFIKNICRKLRVNKLDEIQPYHFDLLNQILDEMERYCEDRAENTERILEYATDFMTAREIADGVKLSSHTVKTICSFLVRKGYMDEETTPHPEKKKSVLLRYKTIKRSDE